MSYAEVRLVVQDSNIAKDAGHAEYFEPRVATTISGQLASFRAKSV
jgi:hypothetical protein